MQNKIYRIQGFHILKMYTFGQFNNNYVALVNLRLSI